MKRGILFIALCCLMPLLVWPANKNLKYVEASSLTLVGKAMPTPANVYHRVDVEKYSDMPKHVKNLFTYSAGLAVSFKTNSPTVVARWTTEGKRVMGNMTPIAQRGLDLYMYSDDGWMPVGVGTPTAGKTEHECCLVKNLKSGEHRFLLYLPLFDEITSLEIGVDSAAVITAEPSPFRHTILIYGSSILHGASASRAGLAYPARMARNTGFNFVNFGLSGSGKMEPAVANMLKDVRADAFVLDCMPNPLPEEITERTQYLVKTIREHHPGVPIILVETFMREDGYSDQQMHERCIRQSEAFIEQYELLKKEGVKDIYLIRDNHAIGTDHEGSIDGTHPNDLGFDRLVRQYQPQIMKILKRYGIR
ncbi:SGNH/GDSL hydrolase family protein [Barnesiella sp. An55]|uniref:SGNH/GDSL hydrolase family protein n=1 Tax=Barnesiella sp. An55 TaxID=1965646 RepID=UPI000B376528|nr:SGNH/GDSL hydrolase family protein [Barnesiella sp. An55]OUN72689.1 hydrolase [Barnesiella sp. An55]